MQRIYIAAPITIGAELEPSEAQAHYLANVLRLAPGDGIMVFNGQHGEWLARIGALRRGRAVLEVERELRPQRPSPELVLAWAPLKRDATDLLVRQATELGVTALLPVTTIRTNAARINEERLAAIAREAAEQCERLDLPAIAPLTDLPSLLEAWPPARPLAVALERTRPGAPARQTRALLIGPEGGFTAMEAEMLKRMSFVRPISLGTLILRAETAAVAGLALLQAPGWSTN